MPSFLRAASVTGAWAQLAIGGAGFVVAASGHAQAAIEAPTTVPCFDPAEFTVSVEQPEFNANKPGHGQDADWTRRCHWSIAMAGGYATYGDWSGGVAYFYMGEPGPRKAAPQFKHLRSFFEGLPFQDLAPSDELIKPGFCLAKPGELYV